MDSINRGSIVAIVIILLYHLIGVALLQLFSKSKPDKGESEDGGGGHQGRQHSCKKIVKNIQESSQTWMKGFIHLTIGPGQWATTGMINSQSDLPLNVRRWRCAENHHFDDDDDDDCEWKEGVGSRAAEISTHHLILPQIWALDDYDHGDDDDNDYDHGVDDGCSYDDKEQHDGDK